MEMPFMAWLLFFKMLKEETVVEVKCLRMACCQHGKTTSTNTNSKKQLNLSRSIIFDSIGRQVDPSRKDTV
jgi:hypothetical protein